MIRGILSAALIPLLIVLFWRDAPEWVVLVGWGIGFALVALLWLAERSKSGS